MGTVRKNLKDGSLLAGKNNPDYWEMHEGLQWRKATLPPLTRAEEQEMIPRAQAGDEDARGIVIRANLRFVISVAKTYTWGRVPLEDLIAEGVMGLHKSLILFDMSRGLKFISYAVWWIRQAILQALAEQGRLIRLPLNRVGTITKITKAAEKLEAEIRQAMISSIQRSRIVYRPPNLYLRQKEYEKKSREMYETGGFMPSFEDVCEALGWRDLKRETLRSYMATDLSLDYTYDNDTGDAPLEAMDWLNLKDKEAQHLVIEEDSIQEDQSQSVDEGLEVLDKRAQYIIKRYFGLAGDPPDTLENIGRTLSLTRERIRQIKEKALEELSKNKTLKAHFDEI